MKLKPIDVGFFLVVSVLLLSSCSSVDIARVETAARTAEQALAEAQRLVLIADDAVAQAKASGSTEAVVKAERALAVATSVLPTLELTAKTTADAATAARSQAEAGASWFPTVVAIIGTLIPAAGALVVSISKTVQAVRATRQTVSGLDAVRAKMGEDAWKEAVAPELSSAQDESTKDLVRRIQLVARR